MWENLYDEGGLYVHFALHISKENFDNAITVLHNDGLKEKRLYFKDTEDNVVVFYTLDMKSDYIIRLHTKRGSKVIMIL